MSTLNVRINSISRSPLGASTYKRALELSLETLVVTNVSADHRLLTGRSKIVPDSTRSGRGAIAEGIRIAARSGEVPSDLVRDGVGDREVFCEGTGGDLVIVSWVTPSTEPAGRGIVEDCCILEVGAGICEVEVSIGDQLHRADRPKVQSQ